MVWNTTQSAFYKAIDAFNNGEKPCENRDAAYSEKCCGETRSETPPRERPVTCGNNANNRDTLQQYPCRQCPACQKSSPSPFSNLFSDSDMLLIAGLILILSRQNADRKLILALAFVLLT